MSFQPFKVLNTIKSGIIDKFKGYSSAVDGITHSKAYKTIASKSGIIDYNPTNVTYNSPHNIKEEGKLFVYPEDAKDQEHYILIDVIRRIGGGMEGNSVRNSNTTKRADNLDQVVYGTNRFFGEGGRVGISPNPHKNLPTGAGSARRVLNTIAIYMPQTLKFNFSADYGPAEVGGGLGMLAKVKGLFTGDETLGATFGSGLQQTAKLLEGGSSFLSGGLLGGGGAALQRRTNVAPAAMTEMIFNGINYRDFSFEFKFTPRSKRESDIINNMIHVIRNSMLPQKYGSGSIAAYNVPDEFVLRFMKGNNINPYIDQVGLCACIGVDVSYGGDKFSTHPSGDPVTVDMTIQFRELELIERERYNQLRNSARGGSSGGSS